jgi:hypothetical protein
MGWQAPHTTLLRTQCGQWSGQPLRHPSPGQPRHDLSTAQLRVIAAIRRIGFGTIESLHVVGGQPCFESPPNLKQEIKFGSEFRAGAGLRAEEPTAEDRQLLALIASIGDGVIDCIEVRHGLPFRAHRSLPEVRP